MLMFCSHFQEGENFACPPGRPSITSLSTEDESVENDELLLPRELVRRTISEGICKEARVMLKKSAHMEDNEVEVNDCVNIHVPLVDRPNKATMTNLLGIVLAIKKCEPTTLPSDNTSIIISRKLYDIGTKYGKIRPLLSRNQFDLCRRKDLFSHLIIDAESLISIRRAVIKEAGSIGFSVKKCKCTYDCTTNRCICRRLNLNCTSSCKHISDEHCKNMG